MKLIIIHLLITICISVICSIKGNKKDFIFNFITALCLPIGGYIVDIFLFIIRIRAKNYNKIEDENEDYEHTLLFTFEENIKQDNKDIISLEEAILVNSEEVKKKQIKRVLERDGLNNTNILKLAVKNTDIEIAHYASVAILDRRNNLDLKIQELRKKYEVDKNNIQILYEYSSALKEYLKSDLLDEYYMKKHREIYIEILKALIEKTKDRTCYSEIIDSLIENKNYYECKFYCDEFINNDQCEESYLKLLKYYYITNKKKDFYNTLDMIKESSMELSREGLNILRFWNIGEEVNEI